ncbi:MAG: DUF6762 family protein [Lutisporaceae bacterium]
MDNYNVLVLMKKDKATNMLIETIDSYTISEDMSLIEKVYFAEEESGNFIYLTLTTEDVDDWQYYGIYDLYKEEVFEALVDEILDGSGEYNPRWILKFSYKEDRIDMEDKLNKIIRLHLNELQRVLPIIEENKDKYQNKAETEE